MICQAVRNEIVCEVFDIVFRGRLGACSRVAGDAEDSRLARDVRKEGCDADLGCRGITAWVRDSGCLGDDGAVNEFGEAIGPGGVETVVGAEIDDDSFSSANTVNGVDIGFADAYRV